MSTIFVCRCYVNFVGQICLLIVKDSLSFLINGRVGLYEFFL